jgi:hypothetical protein
MELVVPSGRFHYIVKECAKPFAPKGNRYCIVYQGTMLPELIDSHGGQCESEVKSSQGNQA